MFGSSGLVDKLSDLLSVRAIPISRFIDRGPCYRGSCIQNKYYKYYTVIRRQMIFLKIRTYRNYCMFDIQSWKPLQNR